jgi:hypothetical protein
MPRERGFSHLSDSELLRHAENSRQFRKETIPADARLKLSDAIDEARSSLGSHELIMEKLANALSNAQLEATRVENGF